MAYAAMAFLLLCSVGVAEAQTPGEEKQAKRAKAKMAAAKRVVLEVLLGYL